MDPFRNLLGGLPVAIHEPVEILCIPTRDISIPSVFSNVETLFLMHERVRVFSYVISNSRMVLQKSLQSRMAIHEIPVVQ